MVTKRKSKPKVWRVEIRHPKYWGEHHSFDVLARNYIQAGEKALKRFTRKGYYVDSVTLHSEVDIE